MTLLPGDLILTGTPAGVGPIVDGDTVNSVTDYIYPEDPSSLFGPYFGSDVAKLYKRAKQIK